MRYTTFRTCVIGIPLGVIAIAIAVLFLSSGAPEQPAPATTAVYELPETPDPLQTPAPQPNIDQIRATLERWLAANPRNGAMKLVDILPQEPYRATAIRFPEADALKWSNDPNQWSQVRLDLNRDGTDDEKWLLKNGRTYKREMLSATGKTTSTEYFK
jgi:hypothetical protein